MRNIGRQALRRVKQSFWRRWAVLLIMGFLMIALQIYDHATMHQAHQTGQTLLEDAEFIREVILFGFAFPIATGFLLTYLETTAAERDEAANALEERQALVKQVHEATSWEQLVDFVVAIPGSFAEATRTFLVAQRSREESFKVVSSWYRPADTTSRMGETVVPEICQACVSNVANRPLSIMTCQRNSAPNEQFDERYCLWLQADEDGKAALVFDVPREQTLDDKQLQLLSDLGTEIALAVENANLLYVGGKQREATEKERQRIARDLHDTLGQSISYLHLKLDQLSSEDPLIGIGEVQREIANMRDVADNAFHQVRNTLAELRSGDNGHLHEALLAYIEEVSGRSDFSIQIYNRGRPRVLFPHVQRQVLYIAREALNNVEKHARANHVALSLEWLDHELMVKITDDGMGFIPGTVAGGSRYGMVIMDERARALDGRLTVSSALGSGTEVCLWLPVAGEFAYDTETTEADQDRDR